MPVVMSRRRVGNRLKGALMGIDVGFVTSSMPGQCDIALTPISPKRLGIESQLSLSRQGESEMFMHGKVE
jgi:hypothetical protein